MPNIADNLNVLNIFPVAAVTADGLGSAIDLAGYEGEICIIVDVTAGTGNHTMDINFHHADTSGGSYSAITGSALTQVTTTASKQKLSLNTDELKRFIKINFDIGGTSTPTFTISATGLVTKKEIV